MLGLLISTSVEAGAAVALFLKNPDNQLPNLDPSPPPTTVPIIDPVALPSLDLSPAVATKSPVISAEISCVLRRPYKLPFLSYTFSPLLRPTRSPIFPPILEPAYEPARDPTVVSGAAKAPAKVSPAITGKANVAPTTGAALLVASRIPAL